MKKEIDSKEINNKKKKKSLKIKIILDIDKGIIMGCSRFSG